MERQGRNSLNVVLENGSFAGTDSSSSESVAEKSSRAERKSTANSTLLNELRLTESIIECDSTI